MKKVLDTQRLETYYWRLTRDMSDRKLFLFRIFLRGFWIEFALCHEPIYSTGMELDFISDAVEAFNELHDMDKTEVRFHQHMSPIFDDAPWHQ